MRVISGTAGGLRLDVPKNVTRPTTDRVREAIFSILGERVIGARVLDLFSGSGAFGIECLSRGATSVAFVDSSKAACDVIASNLAKVRLEGGTVQCADVFKVVRSGRPKSYDLVFADPPYAKRPGDPDLVSKLLSEPTFRSMLPRDGIGIFERSARSGSVVPDGWAELDTRKYGGTEIVFLKLVEE